MIKYLPDFIRGLIIGLPMAGLYYVIDLLVMYYG
jgi:hypothetical protein